MTLQRLDDVLDALGADGWVRLGVGDYEQGNDDPYRLESGSIRWGLRNPRKNALLELEFLAFAALGGPPTSLGELFYCTELNTGVRLYFSKRGSPRWAEELAMFAARIRDSTE